MIIYNEKIIKITMINISTLEEVQERIWYVFHSYNQNKKKQILLFVSKLYLSY